MADGAPAPRRLRGRALRNALYESTGGRCAICGQLLPPNWHADHILPWSRTKRTYVHEMQPLCPGCNRRKGATVSRQLRSFQLVMIRQAIDLALEGKRTLVADVHPGSGKTLAYLLSALALWRAGVIQRLVIFTPRLNLTGQGERDWKKLRANLDDVIASIDDEALREALGSVAFGPIQQRENIHPLLRKNNQGEMAFGYATTYQSMMANAKMHSDFVDEAATLVIFDEAQQLGDESEHGQGTRSAEVATRVAEKAAFVFVMSGTPVREDDQPLLFADYDPPDERGYRALRADVRADYLLGVKEGYLKEFEAVMHDGRGQYQYFGEEQIETLTLSEISRRVSLVVRQAGYWQPLVDRFVAKLADVQEALPALTTENGGELRPSGLIAANDQAHARQIIAYLRDRHPTYRVLLAVHDERAAKDNLLLFQAGEADILVTVAMAHVGFDHQPIFVLLPLCSARAEGWLRQLFARGLRVWYAEDGTLAVDPELQVLYVIAPDDKRMATFVQQLREESKAGMRAREEQQTGGGSTPSQPRLGFERGAELTETRVQGMMPEGDTAPRELALQQELRAKYAIPKVYPDSRFSALIRELGGREVLSAVQERPAEPRRPMRTPIQTDKQIEKELRDKCHEAARNCDGFMKRREASWQFGDTHSLAYDHFGVGVDGLDAPALEARLRWILAFDRQLREEYGGRR